MKKIIGLDFDEVLAELLAGCIEIHNGKIGGYDIAWERIKSSTLTGDFPVNEETIAEFLYKPYSDILLEDLIQPVNGAFEKLQEFKSAGHTLHVITARQDRIKEHTLRFLDKHYKGLIHEVHFLNHFSPDAVPKEDICRKIGIEMMFEDNMDYALGIANAGIPTFLMGKPWNTHRSEVHPNIKRISGWHEVDLFQ